MITLQDAITTVSGQKQDILYLKAIAAKECPTTLKALRLLDFEYTTHKLPKGYNLVKRDNKKTGFVYYVRYWHEGKMISSKWCTHTNNYDDACNFAEKKRDALISGYLEKRGGEVAKFLLGFYNPNNTIFLKEQKRTIELCEGKRKQYQSVIENDFVPFLKRNKIDTFEKITVPVLDDFQDELLAKGIKSKSANDQMAGLSRIFKYLARKGKLKDNPYLNLSKIPVKQEDKRTHGCYEINILKGIFDKQWENKTSHILNLIIYTTDMRPCEIRSFCENDIMSISGCRFIDLKKSKTENGIRLVPLHETVYQKIMDYAEEKKMGKETPIFEDISDRQIRKAAQELGKMLEVSEKYRETENITFYSGRHFWKTLMNAGGLGEDAEEVFMGHKVSSDVSKLYNHRDKQGKDIVVSKARKIFQILDKYIFEKSEA